LHPKWDGSIMEYRWDFNSQRRQVWP
jgi:hypothetical protein